MYKKIIAIMLILVMQPIFACIDSDLDIQKDVTNRIRNGIKSENPADLDDAIDYTKFILASGPLTETVEDQLKKNLAVAVVNKARILKSQGDIEGASGLYAESHSLLKEIQTMDVNKALDTISSESPTPIVQRLTYNDISDDDAKRFFVQGDELEAAQILSLKATNKLKKGGLKTGDYEDAIDALELNKKIIEQNIDSIPYNQQEQVLALAAGKKIEAEKDMLDHELNTDKITEFNNHIKNNLVADYGARYYHMTTTKSVDSIMKNGFGGLDKEGNQIYLFTGRGEVDGEVEIHTGRGGVALSIKDEHMEKFEIADPNVLDHEQTLGFSYVIRPKKKYAHEFPNGVIPPKYFDVHILDSSKRSS